MDEETIRDQSRSSWLDKDEYDVVILGTGFIESLLAGALSRAGKLVLHYDKNPYYGGYASSFSLNQLHKMLEDSQTNTTNEQQQQEFNINNNNVGPQFKNVKLYQRPEQQPKVEEQPKNEELKEDKKEEVEAEKKEGEVVAETEEKKEEDKPIQVPIVKKDDLFKIGRQFIIDLCPSLLYARGALVELLMSSCTSKYLEFKCPEQNYLYLKDALQKIPSTKGSIFKDALFSLKDKRSIMKFIGSIRQVALPPDTASRDAELSPEELGEIETMEKLSKKYPKFIDYVKSFSLSAHVQSFVLYGLSLIHEDVESVSLENGIKSVALYISSLLVYGPTPFLIAYYGYGDIPQAFVRLSAVFGGTYILERSVQQVNIDASTNSIQGVICTEGQTIKSKYFITTPKYLNQSIFKSIPSQSKSKQYSRCICIVDKMIKGSESCSYITVPPGSIHGNKQTVNVYQMESICVPRGKVLIHFTTLSSSSDAYTDLHSIVNTFLQVNEDICTQDSTKDDKPVILWSAYFNIDLDFIVNHENTLLPQGMFVCSDSPISATIDYASQIDQVKSIFEKICPGSPFMEKVPDSEDIIWHNEEENNNTTTTTDTTTSTTEEKPVVESKDEKVEEEKNVNQE